MMVVTLRPLNLLPLIKAETTISNFIQYSVHGFIQEPHSPSEQVIEQSSPSATDVEIPAGRGGEPDRNRTLLSRRGCDREPPTRARDKVRANLQGRRRE